MPNYISKYLFQFIFQLAMHENSDFFFYRFCQHLLSSVFDYCHPTGCEMIAHYDCSLFLSLNLFPWLSFVFDPFSSLSI